MEKILKNSKKFLSRLFKYFKAKKILKINSIKKNIANKFNQENPKFFLEIFFTNYFLNI